MQKNFITMLAVLALFCAFPPTAHSADEIKIDIVTDKQKVGMDELLGLEIIVSAGFKSIPKPEIDGLDKFEVVSQSYGQQVSIVNLSVKTQKTYSFRLRPLYYGQKAKLRAQIDVGGKTYSSKTVEIELVKSGGRAGGGGGGYFKSPVPQPPPPGGGVFGLDDDFGNFFGRRKFRQDDFIIQSKVSVSEAYVGQEIILTMSLYRAVNIWSKAEFILPDTQGFWTEMLAESERQNTKTENVGGRQYSVTEMSVLLYPLSAGEGEIGSGMVRFQPHPLSSPVRLKSEKIKVKVLRLPSTGKPKNFSGLVGDFSITARVLDKTAKAGKPVRLAVTVTGKGNLQSIPKPQIPTLNGVEIYDPETKDSFFRTRHGSNGSRSFTYVIVPQNGGRLTIPGFSLNFFDLEKKEYRELKTGEINLEVAQGKAIDRGKSPNGARHDPNLFASDIRYIKPDVAELVDEGRPYYKLAGFYLYTFTILIAFGLYAIYIRNKKNLMENQGYVRASRARRLAEKRLRGAEKFLRENKRDQFYFEMDNSLRQYLADKWDMPPSSITPDEITVKLGEANKPLAEKLSGLLNECDSARFSPVGTKKIEMGQLLNDSISVIGELEDRL